MTLIEAQEAEVMGGMVKGILVQKVQDKQATKMEQTPLKTTLEEVKKITILIREILKATSVISIGIMEVNLGKNRVISQNRMLI